MPDMTSELHALEKMTTGELAGRFEELHGRPCRTRHRAYLIRKIAWRIQANAEGGLSERARLRAEELADEREIRLISPRTLIHPPQPGPPTTIHRDLPKDEPCDPRLPRAGSAIIREYKGQTLRVIVLPRDEGFEFEGDRYRTLSAIAKKVTGSHINGFRFFRLGDKQ